MQRCIQKVIKKTHNCGFFSILVRQNPCTVCISFFSYKFTYISIQNIK